MKKQAIFNVGGALASYLEYDDQKIVVDLGKNEDFNPVSDFLLPLAERRGFTRARNEFPGLNDSRFFLRQAFLSHLDNDHISSIEDFDKHFHSQLLTAPCEHPRQNSIFNVVLDIFTDENENRDKVLEMMRTRSPGHGREIQEDYDRPLVVNRACEHFVKLFHIPGQMCHSDDNLSGNCSNNLSIVLYMNLNGHTVLMPGDITNEGMQHLIANEEELRTDLQTRGVDFLVAPHHGLETSFPSILFETMAGHKTKRLNIISEKPRSLVSLVNRSDVDGRYYSQDYCAGANTLGQRGVKTSGGHIVIDYSDAVPAVKVVDADKLVSEFLE